MNTIEFQTYKEQKSHTTDEFPYNTYLCTIPLDFPSVPIHWHEEIELIVIQKGKGLVTLDFIEYEVEAGNTIIVLPGHLHSIREISGERMEYENIIFKKELLFSAKEDIINSKFFEPLFRGEINIQNFITPKLSFYDDFSNIIKNMDSLSEKRDFGFQIMIKSNLFKLFYILIQNMKAAESKDNKKSEEKVKEIISYIHEHYYEDIKLKEVADFCNYSPSHFMRFFKEHLHTSFTKYLNDYRLIQAKKLLSESDLSILEVAGRCGFNNISYFNRLFKQKYNLTPRELRGGK